MLSMKHLQPWELPDLNLKEEMAKAKEQPFFQFFFLLPAYYCLGVCVAIETYVTINQPLRDPESIVSPNQTFKLGFFSPPNTSNRYVGIIYNVSVLTVVWVANRDKPLNDSAGTFTISEDGNLVVLNGQEEILWSSNVSDSVSNSTAELLDTGNLVLKDNSSGRIIWESFQVPTDSFLQRMRISGAPGTTEKLTSWTSPSDPSTGNFSFGLKALPTAQLFVWNNSKPYWRSGPWNGNVFIGIPNMSSSFLNGFNLIDGNTESAYFTYKISIDWITTYLQLTPEGYFQQKNLRDRQQDWEISWSTRTNPCDLYDKCGPFGSCNPQNSPICTCLPGFQPKDDAEWKRGNWTSGCIRKTSLQCERNNSAGQGAQQDGYIKLTSVKVPDFAEWSLIDSESDCERLCLENCTCIAYAYHTGLECMHWRDPLIDIQQFSSGGADLYIRVARSELDNKRDMTVIIASTVVPAGFFLFLVTAYIFRRWLIKHRGTNQDDELMLFKAGEANQKDNIKSKNLKRVTFEELPLYRYETLAYATNNFHSGNKIGRGGFGQVYKGKLVDGQKIAVKRLSKFSGQGIEEFMNEVVVISKLQHRNLVRLLGCCAERDEKMLIYEYMPNGSLDAYLFDSRKQDLLDWKRRAIIVEGIARGLLYLHRDSRLKIIHRDLKASNILLDENLNPKISDFGLARIFAGNEDQADTRRVVGTYGYMAPEYAMEGIFSEKSDVYSFGVLLLEIVSGRRNSSFSHSENDLNLLTYARRLWNEGEAVKMIDPSISNPSIEIEILRYMHVGLLCVEEFAKDRPNVSGILSMLNSEISDLLHPKQPAFTRVISSETEAPQQIIHSVDHSCVTTLEAR